MEMRKELDKVNEIKNRTCVLITFVLITAGILLITISMVLIFLGVSFPEKLFYALTYALYFLVLFIIIYLFYNLIKLLSDYIF